ncbi:N-acetyltransferase [Gillisia sp. CAL575]|uniref:N-acetyltransferase n=1 Tax=Gillisia sp. CAL575 TaxID=985255 RepID=UPI00039E9012|nr:N-acetyltransferase [Gillisia sp. CAL575]
MMIDVEIKITDNEFLRQFESVINEELVIVEYSQQERKVFLTKLKMPEVLKEAGYLEPFLEALLSYIQEGTHKVVPTNPEIAKYMRKNRRKYKDLLPVGMNI